MSQHPAEAYDMNGSMQPDSDAQPPPPKQALESQPALARAHDAQLRARRDLWLARASAVLVLAGAAAWLVFTLLADTDRRYAGGGGAIVAAFGLMSLLHIRAAASRLGAERATLIELHEAFPRDRGRALTDDLTGLYRRWFFVQRLAEETERARRHGYQVAIVVMSALLVDALRERGRDLLVRVSEAIRQNTRSGDIASFCGAGEFAVCLPHTGRDGGEAFLQKILDAVPRAAGLQGAVAVLPEGGLSADQVLQQTEAQARSSQRGAA